MRRTDRKPAVAVPPRLTRFAALVHRRSDNIPLAEACLEIARVEYPDLDINHYLERIDTLAAAVARLDPGPRTPFRGRLEAVNRVLFQEEGFHGPGHDHSVDPRSSYLNDVLDRRTGLPVLLSVLYLEIGRRLGLDLVGVGMPAHFILRLRGVEPLPFVDPFHGGEILDEEGCRRLLHRVTDGGIDLQPEYLLPWSSKRILDRILHNLKAVHIDASDFRRARRVVDAILVIRPDNPDEIRDRGMLAYRSLLFSEALEDLERYLTLAPRAKDATSTRAYVQSLKRLVPSVN